VAPFTRPFDDGLIVFGAWLIDGNFLKSNIYEQAKLIVAELDLLLEVTQLIITAILIQQRNQDPLTQLLD